MKIKQITILFVFIAIAELAGIVGSFFTVSAIPTWYATIAKPTWNPPSWVFGPVWTMLYAIMGIAAFLIWRKGWDQKAVKIALGIFGVQLFLNAIWSVIFFGFKNPGWAFVDIVFLWIAIVATMVLFAKVSKPALWLLVPYLLWVSFASVLNFTIWDLNKDRLSERPVFCTADAMQCPDGSYVGRSVPNCAFVCPQALIQ